MFRAVELKHCLDEIDNTIKPLPVWMHHYDPLLHQPLQMEHTSLALGRFAAKKYNYKRLAWKCVLFRMCRQPCTSSDMCELPAHISPLSSGPAFFIYIETRSPLEQRWTHSNMIFFPSLCPLIVVSYLVLLSNTQLIVPWSFYILCSNENVSYLDSIVDCRI